jgi:hypothetical protein
MEVMKNRGQKPGEYEFIISRDIYRYDIQENKFEKTSTLPFPMNKPKWTLHDNRMYIMGGETVPAAGNYIPAGSTEVMEGYMFQDEFFGYHSDLNAVGVIT